VTCVAQRDGSPVRQSNYRTKGARWGDRMGQLHCIIEAASSIYEKKSPSRFRADCRLVTAILLFGSDEWRKPLFAGRLDLEGSVAKANFRLKSPSSHTRIWPRVAILDVV